MAAKGRRTGSTKKASVTEPTADMRIVVLHGKEPFIRRERTRRLVAALEAVHGEIQRFEFDGQTAEVADVLDECRSYGLLQAHKLVVVDDADALITGRGGEDDEGGSRKKSAGNPRRASLERYAASPVAEATLVLRSDTWRRGKLDSLIEACGAIIPCEPVTAAIAPRWCVQRCGARYDATIEPDAAAVLVERIGTDLGRLDMELMKLATSVGPGGTIDRATVGSMTGMAREDAAWSIQQAVATGDPAVALGKLLELFEVSRVAEEPIAWSLLDLCRKIHGASAMLREGASPAEVGKALRLWPREVQDLIVGLGRRIEPDTAAQLLRLALRTDARNKRGIGVPRRSLEAITLLLADEIGTA